MPRGLLGKAIIALTLCSLSVAARPHGRPHPLDTLLLAGENIPLSMHVNSLGGAGVAIVDGIQSALVNPAVIHNYMTANAVNLYGMASYGRDDAIFSEHLASGGLGAALSPLVSSSLIYRYSRSTPQQLQHEAILTFAGVLFQGEDTAVGSVTMGFNIKYQSMRWQGPTPDTLWTTHHSSVVDSTSYSTFGSSAIEQRRLLLDLGFYQNKVSDAIDFGLTFHDVLGYLWKKRSPAQKAVTDTTSIAGTAIDSLFYTDDQVRRNIWLPRYYKGITCGILFHATLIDGNLLVQIPLDVNALGVFDLAPHFSVRTGLEAVIKNVLCLRFGYARAPSDVIHGANSLINTNILSGGAGFRTDHFAFDLAFGKYYWGIQAGISF
jgi:hypothetical protein